MQNIIYKHSDSYINTFGIMHSHNKWAHTIMVFMNVSLLVSSQAIVYIKIRSTQN